MTSTTVFTLPKTGRLFKNVCVSFRRERELVEEVLP